MKIYIAAPYAEREYAIRVMHACEARGIDVTSRWLKMPSEETDEWARFDLEDVASADWLVALNPPQYANKGTGGRHAELGYALALGKSIALIGEKSNIFHYLSHIVRVDNFDPVAIAHGLLLTALDRARGEGSGG